MSQGIGKHWLEKYMSDVYPSDEIRTRAGKLRPPRYYDQQLEKRSPQLLKEIIANRIANLTDEQKSGARNMDREKILKAKAHLRRNTL